MLSNDKVEALATRVNALAKRVGVSILADPDTVRKKGKSLSEYALSKHCKRLCSVFRPTAAIMGMELLGGGGIFLCVTLACAVFLCADPAACMCSTAKQFVRSCDLLDYSDGSLDAQIALMALEEIAGDLTHGARHACPQPLASAPCLSRRITGLEGCRAIFSISKRQH
jgi:hypothetical protein